MYVGLTHCDVHNCFSRFKQKLLATLKRHKHDNLRFSTPCVMSLFKACRCLETQLHKKMYNYLFKFICRKFPFCLNSMIFINHVIINLSINIFTSNFLVCFCLFVPKNTIREVTFYQSLIHANETKFQPPLNIIIKINYPKKYASVSEFFFFETKNSNKDYISCTSWMYTSCKFLILFLREGRNWWLVARFSDYISKRVW